MGFLTALPARVGDLLPEERAVAYRNEGRGIAIVRDFPEAQLGGSYWNWGFLKWAS